MGWDRISSAGGKKWHGMEQDRWNGRKENGIKAGLTMPLLHINYGKSRQLETR
jgi:hypothetical protein